MREQKVTSPLLHPSSSKCLAKVLRLWPIFFCCMTRLFATTQKILVGTKVEFMNVTLVCYLWERTEKWREAVWDREVDGKGGRQGMNEISQLWFDLSHVMAGHPLPHPPPHSDFLTLSLLIFQPLKYPSPGFSEQKEAPIGGLSVFCHP